MDITPFVLGFILFLVCVGAAVTLRDLEREAKRVRQKLDIRIRVVVEERFTREMKEFGEAIAALAPAAQNVSDALSGFAPVLKSYQDEFGRRIALQEMGRAINRRKKDVGD